MHTCGREGHFTSNKEPLQEAGLFLSSCEVLWFLCGHTDDPGGRLLPREALPLEK